MRLLGSIPGVCGRLSTAALSLDHHSALIGCTSLMISCVSRSTCSMILDTNQVNRVIAARQQLVKHAPVQLLRIKGVSFEDRQAAVQELVPGQPVMFVKEPNHPQDPGAVAISTLDGTNLGFVSRHMKDDFRLPVCFGSVASVGQVPTADGPGYWGAVVSCSPALWGMSLDLLPQTWAQQTSDIQALQQAGHTDVQAATWQEYKDQVFARYQHRCAVTGIPDTEMPLQLVPRWLFNHHKLQMQLNPRAPLVPMCQPLVQLQHMAGEGLDTASLADRQAGLELLQWMNRWAEEECEKYLAYVEHRWQQVEHQGWSLDIAAS